MSVLEYIAGGALIVCSLAIIFFVLLQDNKGSGLSGAISGGDIGGMMAQRGGRDKNEKLVKITKICAVFFFVVTIAVDIVAIIVTNAAA